VREGRTGRCQNLGVSLVPPPLYVTVTAASTTTPAYDLVLLAHVLLAVVGLVALGVAGGSALALRRVLARGAPVPDALARYYRPGVNWAGRLLFLVPVFGVALLAMSGGQWGFADTWVSVGMAGWALVAVAAEVVVWPGERRLQEVVTALTRPHRPHDGSGPDVEAVARCTRTAVVGLGLGVVLVVIGVLMVAKP